MLFIDFEVSSESTNDYMFFIYENEAAAINLKDCIFNSSKLT